MEGEWIHDSLVIHQLVTFVIGEGVELIGFRIPDNVMCFDDLGLTRFLEWLLDFVQDVLAHDAVIQLGFPFAVKVESPDFAFDLSLLGLVAIILGTFRYKFDNVVVIIQFTRKLPKVIAQDRVRLILVCPVHDGVRVVVENAVLQLLQGGIEAETGPTGSETGHKNVHVG